MADHRVPPPGRSGPDRAVERARALFLDDAGAFGCAETAYLALAEAFDLPGVGGSGPAMALNGGVAYGGGICGAISGAALAVGALAEARIADHRTAKRVARTIVAETMDRFAERHGSVECRDLIGIDLRAPGAHDAFMASGAWRETCMAQVELVVGELADLADPAAWTAVVARVEGAAEPGDQAPPPDRRPSAAR